MAKKRIFTEEEKRIIYDLYVNGTTPIRTLIKFLRCGHETLEAYLNQNSIKRDTKAIVNLRENTCLKRYNVKNPSQNDEIKIKKTQTCLKNYGVEYSFQSAECQEKSEKTCLKKYGVKKTGASKNVIDKRKETCIKRYGVPYAAQNEIFVQKAKKTCIKRYGVDSATKLLTTQELMKKTNLERYGVENGAQAEIIKDKMKKTCLKKYGTLYASQNKIVQQKIQNTKRENHTFNTSKAENEILNILKTSFECVRYQYKDKRYPFNCDFYIPELDLFIEYQGHWTHGKHPFNKTNKDDLQQLEIWKNKAINSNFYKNAIRNWTKRDPQKRQFAKNNNLNWIEFFNMKEFIYWFNNKKKED